MADNTYTNISDLPTLASVGENTWTPVEVTGKVGKKVDLNTFAEKSAIPPVGTLDTTPSATQTPSASESLSGIVKLHKVSKTGKYSDLIQLPKLDTKNYTSQTPDDKEVIDNTIRLHRISKTGEYKDLQAIFDPDDLSTGSWCYWLEEQSTGGAYYEDDGDVDLILQFFTNRDYDTHYASGLNTLYYVDYPSEYGTDDSDIPAEKRHPTRDYTSLTKLTLLVNNDGDSDNIPITTFVLQRQPVSKILDVEVALYDGKTDWDMEDPPLSSITPLTCVSTLKTVDTSKPGIIRVTGEVFEILQ